jgi:hypothetical protein
MRDELRELDRYGVSYHLLHFRLVARLFEILRERLN